MDDLVEPLGLRLPVEAKLWWGWHDGAEGRGSAYAIGLVLPYLQLGEAIQIYSETRQIAHDVTAEPGGLEADDLWRPEWFPITVPLRGFLVCDCSTADGDPTPIHLVDFEFADVSKTPVAPSFGALVERWLEALDAGAWIYNPDRNSWEDLPHLLPNPGRRLSGVIG